MERLAVAIVIYDGVSTLNVTGPLDVFARANALLSPMGGYDVTVVAPEQRPIRASNGLTIVPDSDFTDHTLQFDTVLIAADLPHHDASGNRARAVWFDEQAIETIRSKAEPMVCTPARAAHGIELALARVARDHGTELAVRCAQQMVSGTPHHAPWSDSPRAETRSQLARVQAYVCANPGAQLSINRLAEVAAMSPRSLARLFVAELGMTPHDYVEMVRFDRAYALIAGTEMALKVIAHDSGFGTAEQMRVVFQRRLGISPAALRQRKRQPRTASTIPRAQGIDHVLAHPA